MKRILNVSITIVLSLISTISAIAQDDVRQQINEIKLKENFQKTEMSDEDLSKASEAASMLLLAEANMSRRERGLDSLLQKHFLPFVKVLSYQRGAKHKAFAYVDLIELDKFSSGISFAQSGVPVPVARINIPSPTPEVTPTPASEETNFQLSPTLVKNQLMMYLSLADNGAEVYKALGEYKNKGGIADYGKVASKSQLEMGLHLVLISNDLRVLAVLVPQEGGTYQNLVTEEEDSWTNYHGGGIVWFQF